MGNVDDTAGVFDALDMGCCTGTVNYGADSANFEISTRGVTGAISPPGKNLENGGVKSMASSLRDYGGVAGATFPCGTGGKGVSGAGTTGSGVLGNGTLAV